MPVVSNTTPILYLAKLRKLQILKETYRDVVVTSQVWQELVSPLLYGRQIPRDVPLIVNAGDEGWLKIKNVIDQKALRIMDGLVAEGLGLGKASSIALAYDERATLLANDEAAILAARRYRIRTRWFTEILLDALTKSVIKTGGECEAWKHIELDQLFGGMS